MTSDDNTALLAVDTTRSADGPVLKVVGELDLSTVDMLVEAGRVALAGPPETLAVDMSGVDFCDSAGINGLVKLRNLGAEHDWTFRVINLRPHVRRVIADLTGLREFLGISEEAGTPE